MSACELVAAETCEEGAFGGCVQASRDFTQELDWILRGHADIFDELKKFQGDKEGGNRVTLFAGNHDIDLYWDHVQSDLRKAAGNLNIELGSDWYKRYGNRLWIGHGHMLPSTRQMASRIGTSRACSRPAKISRSGWKCALAHFSSSDL
jgi:hypothetical protein